MSSTHSSTFGAADPPILSPDKRRNLAAACIAHVLHDGYTDGLYAFLPTWQAEFGLSYAGLALVRALYYGTMGGLQMPGDRITRTLSARGALAVSTLVAAVGFVVMSLPLGFAGLCVGLVLAGLGSSIQHPRASLLVTDTYADAARQPLGIYNFSGDLGKAMLPAAIALLLPILAWQSVTGLLAALGIAVAMALLLLAPSRSPGARSTSASGHGGGGGGFVILMIIGAFDTATRMGYLLFLPFLIEARGGTTSTVGVGLALLFVGGAFGKATCGWLGDRLGIIGSVVATETATAILILATLITPLAPTLILLPLLGIVLNGTSSVLYGTVPELARGGDAGRAFALFYTAVIGAGGFAPIGYGLIADATSRTVGLVASAATAAVIVPMVFALRLSLARGSRMRT